MVPIAQKYEAELLGNGTLTKEELDTLKSRIIVELNRAYDASKSHKFNIEDWKSPEWEAIKHSEKYGQLKETGVPVQVL
jgi:2-oxoglutarate dehydrogenase E1 component